MNFLQKASCNALLKIADFISSLSYSKQVHLSNFIGASMWYLLSSRRKLAINAICQHLKIEQEHAKKIARENFNNIALAFLNICSVKNFDFDKVEVKNKEALERIRTCQQAVITTTAHLGPWEFLAALIGKFERVAHPKSSIVVRSNRNIVLNNFINTLRTSGGTNVIGHRDSSFTILKALKRNAMIGFLVDHNCRYDEAIFLDFLGEEAAVNKGPALLAVRANALVFPTYLVRENGKYIFIQEDALDCSTLSGTLDEKVKIVAEFYSKSVEEQIKKYPEQWFWIHKRWKTKRCGE